MKKIAIVLLVMALLCLAACGEKDDSEAALRTRLEKKVKLPVISFMYDDFDSDGSFEAIAFVGQEQNIRPDDNGGYTGEIWFVNAKGAKKIDVAPQGSYWAQLDIDVLSGRKLAFTYSFGQESGLNAWGVEDGKPFCGYITEQGLVYKQGTASLSRVRLYTSSARTSYTDMPD